MKERVHGEVSFGPADMQELLDRLGVQAGMVPENPTLEAVAAELDGEDPEAAAGIGPGFREALELFMRRMFELRVQDPEALDVLTVKMVNPQATHETIRQTLADLGWRDYGHRARVCEVAKRLVRRCPEFEGVMVFDSRGGDRHSSRARHASGRRLRAELEALRAAEAARPASERRAVDGPGGLLEDLAERHRILGPDGRPSWRAVKDLVRQARKTAQN